MKPGVEVSQVELTAKEADIAMRSYGIVGYRVVGLEHDGAFVPRPEKDGRLVLDRLGSAALHDCMTESIRYNLAFKDRIIQTRLTDQTVPLPQPQLDNLYSFINRIDTHVEEYLQVCESIGDFLELDPSNEVNRTAS